MLARRGDHTFSLKYLYSVTIDLAAVLEGNGSIKDLDCEMCGMGEPSGVSGDYYVFHTDSNKVDYTSKEPPGYTFSSRQVSR